MLEKTICTIVSYMIRGAATQLLIDLLKAIIIVLESRQDNDVDEEVKDIVENKAKLKDDK